MPTVVVYCNNIPTGVVYVLNLEFNARSKSNKKAPAIKPMPSENKIDLKSLLRIPENSRYGRTIRHIFLIQRIDVSALS